MMNETEEFYKAEAEYWRTEAQRLKDLLTEIANKAWHRDYVTAPPEPPVGTRFYYENSMTWERTTKGWVCSNPQCNNCPTDWPEAWQFGISGMDTRALPLH